jgi:predicted  nucleic acid-binding Zn-ribbon protein
MMKLQTAYVFIGFFAIAALLFPLNAYSDVWTPKKQMELKVPPTKVFCKEGLVRVIKVAGNEAACVKPASAEKLVKLGWAHPVDTKLLEKMQMRKQIGQVNTLAVVKVAGDAGRLETAPRTVAYDFIFEVCAQDTKIRAPEVLVKSDSEVKSVKLVSAIDKNTCNVSAVKIKAASPDSITGTLVNKGGITERISGLENRVQTLQEQLVTEKKSIDDLSKMEIKPEDYKQKVGESSNNIRELRTDLNNAREELYRYFFIFYAKQDKISEYKVPLSFSGTPIEGASANKLSVTSQVTGGGYNVVFEACAGQVIVRAPMVNVESDTEKVSVNLANKISPNSCQLSTAQIKASKPDSIIVKLANTGETSSKVTDLENKITQLQQNVADAKKQLNELVRLAPEKRPADFDVKVNALTIKISDWREQINNNKTTLYRFLSGFYQN